MVELAGWHGKYDSNVGTKLIHEMVKRDVNHPSVTWWANGNEGGHNFEIDKEFTPLDPQKRPVLHPQKKLRWIRNYALPFIWRKSGIYAFTRNFYAYRVPPCPL